MPAEAPIAARIRMGARTGFGGGAGVGGGNRRSTRRWLLMSGADGCDSKKLLQPKVVLWELLCGTVATQHVSWRSFSRTATSSSMTLANRRTCKTLPGTSLLQTATSNRHSWRSHKWVEKTQISTNNKKRKWEYGGGITLGSKKEKKNYIFELNSLYSGWKDQIKFFTFILNQRF